MFFFGNRAKYEISLIKRPYAVFAAVFHPPFCERVRCLRYVQYRVSACGTVLSEAAERQFAQGAGGHVVCDASFLQ